MLTESELQIINLINQVTDVHKRSREEVASVDSDCNSASLKQFCSLDRKASSVSASEIVALSLIKRTHEIIVHHHFSGEEKPSQPYTYGSRCIKIDNQLYERHQIFYSRKKVQYMVWQCKHESCISSLKTIRSNNKHTILEAPSQHQHGDVAGSDPSDLEESSSSQSSDDGSS